jgi:Reverse transcriptase (RNA-dependent DNA polymerase)/Retroviral aspartyl protease
LEELEKKYDLPNPRHPAFAPLPPEVIKEHPRSTWKEVPHPKNSFSSKFDAYETVVAIAQSTMYGALDLLQDYDVHGQWGFMISPKTVVQLCKMSLDDAAKWLETNMPQTMAHVRSQVQEPNFMDKVLGLSLLVHGLAVTLDDKRSYPFLALIDSGCTLSAIDKGFVEQHKLKTKPYKVPFCSFMSDGSEPKSGLVTDYVEIQIKIGTHQEVILCAMLNLAKMDFFLGYDWLRKHNPEIDWEKKEINFSRCLSGCGHPSIVRTTAFDTYIWQRPVWFRAYATISTKLTQKAAAGKQEKTFKELVPEQYREYQDVFEPTLFDELPTRKPWDHAINLKPDAPDHLDRKLYPLSPDERWKLDKFLDENLRTGRIRPSKSPYASPFFFVKKKDAKDLRPIQDYRKLNTHTIDDKYPLPLISDIISQLADAKYFTKLDVRWGFNNVRIKEGDKQKTAFLTPRGLFEPTVMFFRLKNSPPTFQQMMNHIFQYEIREGWLLIYMDDLLIFSKSLDEHQARTKRVLDLFRENNLFLKPTKCTFDTKWVEYLGIIVEEGQVRMDPVKTNAISDWPVPKTKKELQSFLGFMNFYRQFIKDFSKIAVPLNKHRQKRVGLGKRTTRSLRWTQEDHH